MAKLSLYSTNEQLNQSLAATIKERLNQAIQQKGSASLVVSGGKTPISFFHCLRQQVLPWDKVYITLADERWVEVTDEDSNEKLVKDHLLQDKAAQARFVGLKNQETTPFNGAAIAEKQLQQVPRPFDVVILGMGNDGHTASMFPRMANLQDALDTNSTKQCIGATPNNANHDRISLTLSALLNSHYIYIHIVGKEKRQVYQQAIAGKDVNEMPIRAILQQTKVPVEIVCC